MHHQVLQIIYIYLSIYTLEKQRIKKDNVILRLRAPLRYPHPRCRQVTYLLAAPLHPSVLLVVALAADRLPAIAMLRFHRIFVAPPSSMAPPPFSVLAVSEVAGALNRLAGLSP